MLFSDRVEKFLRILRLTCELLLLSAGCLGFFHAAKFLGGVLQSQVSVSFERYADKRSIAQETLVTKSFYFTL